MTQTDYPSIQANRTGKELRNKGSNKTKCCHTSQGWVRNKGQAYRFKLEGIPNGEIYGLAKSPIYACALDGLSM
jgi:hypothetical protein